MSCEELIARVFGTRNHANLEHWKTKSYAQHQALGGFYEEVISILDRFIEAYIGLGYEVKELPKHTLKDTVLKCLIDDAKWIAENREKLAESVEALENILDELVALYLTTIYKLKNLK